MAATNKHHEEQTECLSDHGTTTSAFLRQEYFDLVLHSEHHPWDNRIVIWFSTHVQDDMHADWLGRSTYQIVHPFRWRGSCDSPYTSDRLAPATYNLQWLRIRHNALEVHAATT